MQLGDIIIDHVRNKNVLHVGCVGTLSDNDSENFRMHKFLENCASSVQGIDIDRQGITRMKDLGYDVHFSDAATFQTDQIFDSVLILSVLQFVESPMKILRNMRNLLKNGGDIFISVPNPYSPYSLYRDLLRNRGVKKIQSTGQSQYGEIYLFSQSSLHLLLKGTEFKIDWIKTCFSKPSWSNKSFKEGLYNLCNNLPGKLFSRLRPTLVAKGTK